MLYLESINNSLFDLMKSERKVILLGEDLLDIYGGGAFKVSKGLSTKFPEQVISTPISEQAITGAAIGMAMRGMKPIVEIMFGDFITLCVDQIVNHATKYNYMYNKQVTVPVVIRTPMGGGRGYGPTHSQTLEGLFMSVPDLKIIAPSIFHNPGKMLAYCVMNESHPCLFIENKLAYPKKLQDKEKYLNFNIKRVESDNYQNVVLSLYPDQQADALIISYGGMAELAANCAHDMFLNEEILVDVLILGSIKPFAKDLIIEHSKKIGRVVVLEEGNMIGGWGSEVSSVIHENGFNFLKAPVMRLGSDNSPIPAAMPMEIEVLPNMEKLYKLLQKLTSNI
jgi:pyruvate/2-oxoglutarate/acetoin dehydrogenase E1 component